MSLCELNYLQLLAIQRLSASYDSNDFHCFQTSHDVQSLNKTVLPWMIRLQCSPCHFWYHFNFELTFSSSKRFFLRSYMTAIFFWICGKDYPTSRCARAYRARLVSQIGIASNNVPNISYSFFYTYSFFPSIHSFYARSLICLLGFWPLGQKPRGDN